MGSANVADKPFSRLRASEDERHELRLNDRCYLVAMATPEDVENGRTCDSYVQHRRPINPDETPWEAIGVEIAGALESVGVYDPLMALAEAVCMLTDHGVPDNVNAEGAEFVAAARNLIAKWNE